MSLASSLVSRTPEGYSPVPTTPKAAPEHPSAGRVSLAIGSGSLGEPADKPDGVLWRIGEFAADLHFQSAMALLIIANSLVIGFETDMPQWPYWDAVEQGFLIIFLLELALRLVTQGHEFFVYAGTETLWNYFDVFVIALGVFDAVGQWLALFAGGGSGALVFRMIRLLRILRIFRIVRFLKQLYLLAFGLAEAVQAVFWVTILMAFFLYFCAIILTRFVGTTPLEEPYGEFLQARFGTIMRSMLTLFELMSAPNLPDYQKQGQLLFEKPLLAVFLVTFVIFGSFGMIALLTGVISESMFEKNQTRQDEEKQERDRIRKLIHDTCDELFDLLEQDDDGRARTEDIRGLLPTIERVFDEGSLEYLEDEIIKVVDLRSVDDEWITRNDFCEGITALAIGVRSVSIQELESEIKIVGKQVSAVQDALEKTFDTKRSSRKSRIPSALCGTPQVTMRSLEKMLVELGAQVGNLAQVQSEFGTGLRDLTSQVEQLSLAQKEDMQKAQEEVQRAREEARTAERELKELRAEVSQKRGSFTVARAFVAPSGESAAKLQEEKAKEEAVIANAMGNANGMDARDARDAREVSGQALIDSRQVYPCWLCKRV